MKKKLFSMFLALCMVLTLLPTAALAQDVSLPEINVMAGVASPMAAASVGGFTVEGGTEGTDYKFEYSTLTILSGTPLTIRTAGETADRIAVGSGVTANLTLDGVTIKTGEDSPLGIPDGATANVTLAGDNTLTAEGENSAGIHVPEGATLTIGGDGTLAATGSSGRVNGNGSGIGGGGDENGGTITITGGTVTAVGSDYGAGIGGGGSGGNGGGGGNISITGGIVTATGATGAGIGGGGSTSDYGGNSGTIRIDGGIVTATGSGGNSGAGIGGGGSYSMGKHGGGGVNITITGGIVTAGSGGGAGIGAGQGVNSGEEGSNVTVSGGTVTATGGSYGAIGAGDGNSGTLEITGGSVKLVQNSGATSAPATRGGAPLKLVTMALPGVSAETPLSLLHFLPAFAYGGKDVQTDGEGKLYVWLPETGAPETVYAITDSDAFYKKLDGTSDITLGGFDHTVATADELNTALTSPAGDKQILINQSFTINTGTYVIPTGVTLTIAPGVTLTNNGIIRVDGGTLNGGAPNFGAITGSGTVYQYKDAQSTAISLWEEVGTTAVTKAEPGKACTLRLTVERPAFAARSAFTEQDKANFYLGADNTGAKIGGTVTFTEQGGKLIAEVAWTPTAAMAMTEQTIFVEYGMLAAGGGSFVNPGTATTTVGVLGVAEVNNAGTKTEYATLPPAILAAAEGSTIKLLANFDLGDKGVTIGDISLTLDLNGKTLTTTTNGAVPLLNYSGAVGKTLTIKDGGMGGMVKNLGKGWAISNSSTGEISVTGGTISANNAFTILNSIGTLTVTGGTVENTGLGNAINSSASGVVTISGDAKVTSTSGAAIYLSGKGVKPENSLVVKGGTVENTGIVDGAIFNGSTGAVSITGGTVISKAMYTISNYSTGAISVSGGMVLAKGGTFGTLYNASTGSISITGGTVIHQADGGLAVYNASTGAVSFTGGLILGEYANNNSSTDISWSMKGAQTLPISATLPAGITFTIPKDSTLTIPSEVTLTNSGTLKLFGALDGTGTLAGSGSFTAFGAEDITIPDQYYTGSPITPTPTLAATRTVMGKAFTVKQSGYKNPVFTNNTAAGTATATYTYTADPSLTIVKNFTILQSGTEFVGGITTDKIDKTYTYGETITVTVTPKATGAAPRARAATAPTAGQMALFWGDTQISDAADAVNGTYTMTIDTKDKTLAVGSNTITAKYVGTASMADYSEEVTVKLNPKPISSATVSADETKDYNGKSAFTGVALTPNPDDIFSGDTVTATAAGNAAGANAGTHSFTATGVTLSGAQGSYYSLAASAVSGNVEITKAPLTIAGGTVTRREYDGTTAAAVTALTFSGLQNGEALAIATDYTVGTPTYDSADAGTTKTVTGTAALAGNAKTGNYTLTGAYSITNQTIDKKTGIAAPTGVTMDDTTTTKSFTFGPVSGYTDVTAYEWKLHTDADTAWTSVTANPITFGNRAGKIQVRVKGTTNYAAGAVYTHNTAFTATLEGSVSIDGTAAYGETLTAKPTGTQAGAVLSYEWKSGTTVLQAKSTSNTYKIAGTEVGKAITLEVTADGYTGKLISVATTAVAPKQVTATAGAISKVYDGTTAVETADQTLTIAKVNASDDITVTMPYAVYNNADVGTGTSITVGNLAITGAAKDWYTVTAPTGVTGEITAKPLTAATVTVNGSYTYNGTAQTPAAADVTVMDGTTRLTNGTDYTYTAANHTNAGTGTVNVTFQGNYSGTASGTFAIGKAPLTIAGYTAEEKDYDGKTDATVSAVTFTGLQNSESLALNTDYTASASFATKDAGTGIAVSGTATLTNSDKAKNYSLASGALSGQSADITAATCHPNTTPGQIKINSKLANIQGQTASGVNGEAVAGTFTWSETADGAALDDSFTFTGDVGDVVLLYVTFTPTSGNYKVWSVVCSFTLTNKDVPVLTVENLTKTYDGVAVTPVTGTAKVGDTAVPGTFSFVGAPLMKDAGTYNAVVNFTPTDSAAYETASIGITVIINKATITIKAKDKSAFVGDAVPALSGADYTVSGLVSGETLTTLPSLDYAATPDMSKAGSVAIIASGAAAPDGGNYNDIVYQPGTLTITAKGGGSTGGGGGVTTYTITATAGEHGSITPGGKVSVSRNADRSFTVKPDEGYAIADVLVDGASVGAVSTYTFEKVTKSHTISVSFAETPAEHKPLSFADVDAGAWYYDAVAYVCEKGLFTGTSATTFSPELSMSRAMLWTVLARMDGQDVNGGATWYEKAQTWAAAQGVTDGASPEADMTREQLAVMLYRYAKAEKTDADLKNFSDADSISPWAADAMSWAVARGILTGKSGSRLDPQSTASRAEVATMLQRFVEPSKK